MIEIVDYKPSWPAAFQHIGRALRAALGQRAVAIHHIGSTAVPGLAAKDVIDVQVTVTAFAPELREQLEAAGLGLVWRDDIVVDHRPPGMDEAAVPQRELEKRLAHASRDAARWTNVHIRIDEHFNQRYPLLCRDFLRAHPHAAAAYGEIKRQLARHFPDDADAYYDIKDPVFDVIMAGARNWAATTHWQPAPSDA